MSERGVTVQVLNQGRDVPFTIDWETSEQLLTIPEGLVCHGPIFAFGSLHVRSEWLFEVTDIIPARPPSFWSRMANSLLSLAQITRDAVGLFRNSNAFLARADEQFGAATPPSYNPTAHERSLELLRAWLTGEQLASFERTGSFEVTGGSSGVRYLLRSRYSFGVEPLEGPQRGLALCVVPRGAAALGDILLAQKIGLETSERATLARANKAPRGARLAA
jgi:hypothetical protein